MPTITKYEVEQKEKELEALKARFHNEQLHADFRSKRDKDFVFGFVWTRENYDEEEIKERYLFKMDAKLRAILEKALKEYIDDKG